MRDSFIFYRSFIEGLDEIDDATFRRLIEALTRYALDGIEPKLSGLEKGLFVSWKANIDAANKRRDNGKLGGRPAKEITNGYEEETNGYGDENHRLSDTKPNINVNDNVNDNVNENDNENGKKVVRFTPPSPSEIKAYCQERNNGVDPDAFYDFYESKGWKVGNQKMKDWKAAVRTWEKRDNRASPKDKFNVDDYLLKIINGEDTG